MTLHNTQGVGRRVCKSSTSVIKVHPNRLNNGQPIITHAHGVTITAVALENSLRRGGVHMQYLIRQ